MTALIEYFTVLLEHNDWAPSRVGPRAKYPSCPPLSAALHLLKGKLQNFPEGPAADPLE